VLYVEIPIIARVNIVVKYASNMVIVVVIVMLNGTWGLLKLLPIFDSITFCITILTSRLP
jgi:hypothetical protein